MWLPIVVFLIVCNPTVAGKIGPGTIIKIFDGVFDIINLIQKVLKVHEEKPLQNPLQNGLSEVVRHIDHLHIQQEQNKMQILHILQNQLPQRIILEMNLLSLRTCLNKIDHYYNRIKQYTNIDGDNPQFEKHTLENAAKEVVSHHPDSVLTLVECVHEFFNSKQKGLLYSNNSNIIDAFLKQSQQINNGDLCSSNESPQQLLIQLYSTAMTTELKAYTLVHFSYQILNLYGYGNFTNEKKYFNLKFTQRTEAIMQLTQSFRNVSRKLWLCDPKMFVKNENYVEMTELLQGHIQNVLDLNADGTCWSNCAAYRISKPKECTSDLNYYCEEQRSCNGQLYNCRFVASTAKVCRAKSGTNRRYDYIEFQDGPVYGNKNGECRNAVVKANSWWRWLIWHCSYCICLCDEHGMAFGSTSDRYINLREVRTNVLKNKVVTGLRFVKRNRVIHLQIQEGELDVTRQIKVNSIKWLPVADYKITDKNVKTGVDYHTLTFARRELDLAGLEANKANEVLTGVRFKIVDTHLAFQICVTSFDIISGRLVPIKSYWKYYPHDNSVKLNLENRDIPTRTSVLSKPDNRGNLYLEFTHSDFNHDVAQTTIPFFDSQDVVSNTPVPLSGAGIYYKGQNGYGGFVAPYVFTFNPL